MFAGRGLAWRLIVPIPLALIAAVALAWVVIPRVMASNATSEAIRASEQVVAQFKLIRAYYTENVVNKLIRDGTIRPSVDHKSNDKHVPLPATMIHDLSALLAKNDTTVNLYSRYPFPNRANRQLDAFQQEAWDHLIKNPSTTFARNEIRDGRQVVRVAMADTMAVQACVNCHNTDAQSPKKNWNLGDVRGVLEVTSVIDAQLASGARLSNWIVFGAIFIGLILFAIALLTARSVTRPIGGIVKEIEKLSAGNHDLNIPGVDRKDEIGLMARSVLTFRDAAMEKARLESEAADQRRLGEEERHRNSDVQATAAQVQARMMEAVGSGLSRLAGGDLTVRLTDGFTDESRQIKDDFNIAIARLQGAIGEIATTTREVSNAAAEISTSTTDLSQRTEEQAASLEETSASMEQISATVKQNAENAQQANQFAVGTREVADRGGEVVAEAVKAMSRIEESSRKISDIIGVIDEIARQTNLLALNAAVEAARAGEAGRGFAVVASEVRSLAQRSSQAAKDIKDLINNSSGQVQEGVELVNRAGTSLNEILASIKKVADIVSDIASASAEQATGLEQVGKALTQMDEVTQQNSALVEENAATAKTLEQQAYAMDQRVAFFRIDGNAAVAQPHVETKVAPKAAAAPRAPAAAPKRPTVVKRAAAAANGSGRPVRRMQTALATAINDDPEWKEF
jgi:methyl-accepting chemotaxis protein